LAKELSAGVKEAWHMAAQEAAAAGSKFLEKEHMLIALCSLEKTPIPSPEQYIVVPSYLSEFEKEKKDIEFVFEHFDLDLKSIRRQIRGMPGPDDYLGTDITVHRSEDCKRMFAQAAALSSSNKVTVMHFLAAIMTNPGETVKRVLATHYVKPQEVAKFTLQFAEPIIPQEEPNVVKPNAHTEPHVTVKIDESQVPSPPVKPFKEKRTKIFVVHGRKEAPALKLKGYLNEILHLDAEMFSDTKGLAGNKTIVEILEQIKDVAAFAFIIITPDDFGNLGDTVEKCKNALFRKDEITRKDVTDLVEVLKPRARQNVIFEYGLFMGALGRYRTCCLVQTDTVDMPSDLSGLLFEVFTENISDRFADIENKLKDPKVGLLRNNVRTDKGNI
jgi:predicted nucleotide-binding protein